MKNYICFEKILVILAFGCCALFAQQSRTFYFLPPDDEKWIAGNSYLYDGEKAELMRVDTAHCGWFTKTFTTLSDVPDSVMIYLGPQGTVDRLDSTGKGATISKRAWIPLNAKFGTSTRTLSLNAGNMQFSNTVPTNVNSERCSYKMAAFIYDTDSSVNPSFNGNYHAPSAGNTGLRRGIVKPDLDTNTRKPVFAGKNNYANWVNAESFNAAFTPYGRYDGKVANIPRCYNMPFGRATNGTWEFDSDRMRTPTGNNLVGGFFPYILDSLYSRDEDGTDRAGNYRDSCSTCNKTYDATCFNPTVPANVNRVPALTYKGETYTGMAAFDRANDRLVEGWNNDPAGSNLYSPYAAYNVYDCGTPAGQPRPGFDGAKRTKANLSFCFESHGEFAYEKGQEFFFRGDDDIWVFINNKLVIDLGGIHNPAPGFVDLDTIGQTKPANKLIEGERYPIDIFFCERMGTQSNVRVSTNMYIVQKSTFYSNVKRPEQPMCLSQVAGMDCDSKTLDNPTNNKPSKYCGPGLTEQGYTLEFYMIQPSLPTDTIKLSPTYNPSCNGDNNSFTCYGGIKLDSAIYSCGGSGQCNGNEEAANKLVNLPGTEFAVYARLRKGNTQVGTPLRVDNIKLGTNPRIVWGKLEYQNSTKTEVLNNAYGAQTTKEQSIIAGKRTPIYIAGGKWKDSVYATTFICQNDQAKEYTLRGTAGLEVTLDSLGKNKPSFPRRPPSGGVDTLWVMGGYELGDKEFEINIDGVSNDSIKTPSLKLTVYQPKLRFVDSVFAAAVNPRGFSHWDSLPPVVGRALDVYVVAWDSLRNALCDHCAFLLKETSSAIYETDWGIGIVQSSDLLRIENGKLAAIIRGKDVVDTISADSINYAKWRIWGPSEGFTFAEWDSLQFRSAPVPTPMVSYIYDRNGDGIGDSLIIELSRSFRDKGGDIDNKLLPILLEVVWEKGYPKIFKSDKYSVDNLKDEKYVMDLYDGKTGGGTFFTDNRAFWDQYLIKTRAEEESILSRLYRIGEGAKIPDHGLLVIANDTTMFSKDILTSGKGTLSSYTPFYDQGRCGEICAGDTYAFMNNKDTANVLDRIPPIVVKAAYTMDTKKKCADEKPGCRESLIAYLSEPIFADTVAATELIKNPFSYCFEYSQKMKCSVLGKIEKLNQKYDNSGLWDWELPGINPEDTAHSSTYRPGKKSSPPKYYNGASKGDSIVELIYNAYKTSTGPDAPTTRMPKATDWVKIRPPSSVSGNYDVFSDAEGNTANPRELGVLISGTNYYKKEQVKIAVIDPNTSPDDHEAILGGIFSGKDGAQKPPWFNEDGRDWAYHYLYNDTAVTEFLPLPKGYSADSAKLYYPGSIGTIFDIATNINTESERLLESCKKSGCLAVDGSAPLTTENIYKGISIHASVYYHTNLGNYTAHRTNIEGKCGDPIFQKDVVVHPERGNNCFGNEYNFYLAWDLKTNKNRYVGTGAYVAITKFYWQIEYKDASGEVRTEKFNSDEAIEMFGVRRGKGK